MKNRTPSILPKIPCGDQLREAWLEAVELHAIVAKLLCDLDGAVTLANDEKHEAKVEAKEAKESIHDLNTKAMQVRDMITVWQAWASDSSNID